MSSSTPRPKARLDAAARRETIVRAATVVFAERGYGGAPTARIAAAAGCNETLLFRHFGSKRGLFLACIDAAWARVRELCDEAIAAEPEPGRRWQAMGGTFLGLVAQEPHPARLWARALVETTGDTAIDEHLAALMEDVHRYAAGVIAESQASGGVVAGRDPRSEAWIVIALALLGTVGERLGPVVHGDFEGVLASHREWLTGGAGG